MEPMLNSAVDIQPLGVCQLTQSSYGAGYSPLLNQQKLCDMF